MKELLDHLNRRHDSIKFTVEKEYQGKLPFLDFCANQNGNKILTSVYMKPTHSRQYLQHTSKHPNHVKGGELRSLMCRTQYITSGEEDQQLEMDNICQVLVGNGFSKEKLRQWMHHEKSRMPSVREPEEQLALCTLPYTSGLSESVQRVLRPLGSVPFADQSVGSGS